MTIVEIGEGLRVISETHEEAARLQEHIWSYRNKYGFITEGNGPMIIRQTKDGRLAVRHVTGCPSVTRAGRKASYALVIVGGRFVYDEDIDLQRLLCKKENLISRQNQCQELSPTDYSDLRILGEKSQTFMATLSTSNLTFTAIDVETANYTRSSICQIGIVHVRNGELQDRVSILVNPEEPFEPNLVNNVHHIDEQDVKDSDTLPQIYDELYGHIDGTVLVSHSGFDRDALNKAADKYGLESIRATWLDSSMIARHAWPQRYNKKWNLEFIANDLGIEFEHHDAAEDARAAAEIVLRACEHTGIDVYGWIESMT